MPSFQDLQLNSALTQRLQELGYHTPTPIQQAAIPLLLQGHDVAGQAETGSGKTAAFGLPLLQKVNTDLQQVQALVLVPTRELAVQVRQELKNLAQHLPNLKISAFYGGHAFSQERASLAFPPQVLVGTPGRLVDHLNRRTLDLSAVKHLVLDEADKLLEMGFEEEVDQLLQALPRQRQALLFSATMPDGVQRLITASLQDPHFVKASTGAVPRQLRFVGIKTGPNEKKEVLARLLAGIDHAGTVVFANTRATTDELTGYLQAKQLSAKALHGGMEQPDRDREMMLFRNGSTAILVATDLAARGLDIDALTTIIHYELPDDEAAYLHRSGRTGRAGKSGTVYTLATSREEQKLHDWPNVRLHEWLKAESFTKKNTTPAPGLTQAFGTLFINGGRKDKLSPRDIVGALVAEAGLAADQIGKIEVQDRASYVAVPKAQLQSIAAKLMNGKIKGKRYKVHVVQ